MNNPTTQTNTTASTTPINERCFVVGAQLDDTGFEAIRLAWSLAKEGDTIHLCYCVGFERGVSEMDAALLDSGQHALQRWAAKKLMGTPAMMRTRLHTMLGDPTESLIRLAADVAAEMIVIGTHEKGVLARMVAGSTVHELVGRAPCPVAVARPKDFSDVARLPEVEPAPVPAQAPRTLASPHTYGYHRSVPLALPQPSVGSGF